MLSLNLPKFDVKVIDKGGKKHIWDSIRHKYVTLTPEEWVRQHFVNYLISNKEFPTSLIANEISIKLNGTTKRCDTVVYDKFLSPLVIVEYKAPHIEITNSVFDQILRYNMTLHVNYLIVSNGIRHFCCKIDYDNMTYSFLKEIPDYGMLTIND